MKKLLSLFILIVLVSACGEEEPQNDDNREEQFGELMGTSICYFLENPNLSEEELSADLEELFAEEFPAFATLSYDEMNEYANGLTPAEQEVAQSRTAEYLTANCNELIEATGISVKEMVETLYEGF